MTMHTIGSPRIIWVTLLLRPPNLNVAVNQRHTFPS